MTIRLEPEAFASGDKSFFITQPGSPVATSLCEGEAKEKKVGLLTVQGKRFKIEGVNNEFQASWYVSKAGEVFETVLFVCRYL